MQGARQVMNDGGIRRKARRFLEREQDTSDSCQVLVALGEVVIDEVIEKPPIAGHTHAPFNKGCTCDSMVAGTNGLVRYSVAPYWSAAARLSSSPRVVSTTTGKSRRAGWDRMKRSTS